MSLYNFQFDSSPVFPGNASYPFGRNNDLTSFQTKNSSTIITAYGFDTPRASLGPFVFDYVGTGVFDVINNTWELMAWGYDTCGNGYFLNYETPVAATGAPADLDIQSRVEDGPSEETLQELIKGVEALGNDELTKLAQQLTKLPIDGRRSGKPPVVCDEACVENLDVASSV